MATEDTPLLTSDHGNDGDQNHESYDHYASAPNATSQTPDTSARSSFPVLLELIGARNLPVFADEETYVVVQFGGTTLHRTLPYRPKLTKTMKLTKALRLHKFFYGTPTSSSSLDSNKDNKNHHSNPTVTLLEKQCQNPIWTVQEDSLVIFGISKFDIDNHKNLKLTLWSGPSATGLRSSPTKRPSGRNLRSIGKLQLDAQQVVQDCSYINSSAPANELPPRLELPLIDELGKPILNNKGEESLLAYRCRFATPQDLDFVTHWSDMETGKRHTSCYPGEGVYFSSSSNPLTSPMVTTTTSGSRLALITERPEHAILSQAPGLQPIPPPSGYVRLKPYPNPDDMNGTGPFITPLQLKNETMRRSTKWIYTEGSQPSKSSASSYMGKLELEILSAHGLPNVDIGGAVGNETDAFACAIYGDSMVQTDVIHDELSPHWPCWTQRAFCFPMQHPSQVLYISLFGFKRSPMHHRPIGRVEVNPLHFEKDVIHNLEYDLCGLSHAAERHSQGKLRIRLKITLEQERLYLCKALQSPPTIFLNATQKKTMTVARYTACGEYDNEEKFSLQVLHGYIEEVLGGYLRRILYSVQDGAVSLFLWRSQVTICGIGLPINSLVCFLMGIAVVENPNWIPSMICLTTALFFLNQMQDRRSSPSPWRRCHSFGHYFRILLWGKSDTSRARKGQRKMIQANEGIAELKAEQEALQQRIAHDKEVVLKKEAVEKELEELEKLNLHTKSKTIPVELLVVLGKVQGIVGDFCRLCRLVDAIVTWEESDISFWITFSLLVLGFVFLFVPFGLLFQWTFRILVVLLLGPQNRLLDLMWYQNLPSEERRVYQIFAERAFEARCRQEDAEKTKAFRRSLFGKYATWVPPVYWSPHMDFPLPSSTTELPPEEPEVTRSPRISKVLGQQLIGNMIPRPEQEWKKNQLASEMVEKQAQEELFHSEVATDAIQHLQEKQRESMQVDVDDEGFEIGDVAEDELLFVQNVGREEPEMDESLRQLGVEILPHRQSTTRSSTTMFDFENAWKSLHAFADEVADEYDSDGVSSGDSGILAPPPTLPEMPESSVEDDEDRSGGILPATKSSVVRIPSDERVDFQSMIELGYEMDASLMDYVSDGESQHSEEVSA